MYHIKQFLLGLTRLFVLISIVTLCIYVFILTPWLWSMWIDGTLVREPITFIIMLPGTVILLGFLAGIIYKLGETKTL